LYWEFHEWGGRKAIRMDNWKFVQYNVFDSTKTTTALYDLGTDVGEVYNVAETFPEVVKKMEDIMRSARFPSDVFKFGSEN
jgi:arylsulfatase A-like enzyme